MSIYVFPCGCECMKRQAQERGQGEALRGGIGKVTEHMLCVWKEKHWAWTDLSRDDGQRYERKENPN